MGRKSNAKKQKDREVSAFEYLLKLGFMYGGAKEVIYDRRRENRI